MSPKKVMPLLLTGITPFVMVSGTARASEPQVILAQAQMPQSQDDDPRKRLQEQQQRAQEQQRAQQQRGAQEQQQRALEQQREQQQRGAQEQQQRALEQQRAQQQRAAQEQQQRALEQQHAQQQKAAQEQQQRALEQQRAQQQKAAQEEQQQRFQEQKAAQEQQLKTLEQQRAQQQKAAQEQQQQMQNQRAAQEQQLKALEQQRLHVPPQNAGPDQPKGFAPRQSGVQSQPGQPDGQRRPFEDARNPSDQAKIQQQLELERQNAAGQRQDFRRELSAEEQKAKLERDAHQAERLRLLEIQQRQAEAERSQAAINERLRLQDERLKAITSQRREVVGPGGQHYIQEPGNRTIFTVNNQTFIRHDETQNFQFYGGRSEVRRGPGGVTVSNIYQPDGSRVEVEVDAYGRPLRRVRYMPDGRRFVLFENRPLAVGLGLAAIGALAVTLPPPPPEDMPPPSDYIVDASVAPEDAIYGALQAPPIAPLDRIYSLDEVLASVSLRQRMRSVAIDTINFDFGSAELGPDQGILLESVAAAIREMANHNPGEVFLIEGHTDAVGSQEDNLSLSDRRAQAVADVLSRQFGIPRENLVTQGYGKQFLLIPTQGPERRNRRVVVRRITPLLQGGSDRYSGGGYGAPYGSPR